MLVRLGRDDDTGATGTHGSQKSSGWDSASVREVDGQVDRRLCEHGPMAAIGLVLGAGGLAGHAFEAGVLSALSDYNAWDPNDATIIVGTSAGSGVAAYLRAGLSAQDLYRRSTGAPLSPAGAFLLAGIERPTPIPSPLDDLSRRVPRPAAPRLMASDLARPWRLRAGRFLAAAAPAGRVPTDIIGVRVRRVHGNQWPSRPTWICAMRLRDGARVVFGRDLHEPIDLGTAVEASSAIPGYFAPVHIGSDRYVDGGAHSPTNADLLAGAGLDAVFVISPMSIERPPASVDPRTPIRLWHKAVLANEVRALRRSGVVVHTFEPTAADVRAIGLNSLDVSRMAKIAEHARRSTLERLERDGSLGALAPAAP